MQNFSIPTTDEIRTAVRVELDAALANFFSTFQFQPRPETDDLGKGAEFASRITGKAVPTIYDLVHKRLIPHSKRGKDLYFSKSELIDWLKAGRRKTQCEIALDAENFSKENPKQTKNGVAV